MTSCLSGSKHTSISVIYMSKKFIGVQQHVIAFISQSWKGETARKHKRDNAIESVDGGVTLELKLRHITNKANNVEYLQSEWHTVLKSLPFIGIINLISEINLLFVGSTVLIVHPIYFGLLTNNITKLVEVRLCAHFWRAD